MIDTHAHILKEYYDDIDSLISELQKDKVSCVLNAATNYNEALEIFELSKKYPEFIKSAIGIHPESINDNSLDKIEELIKNNKIYAIGEIGLDYYWKKDNKEEQRKLFINQIELANKYNLPIVVHIRESIQDCLDILKTHKCRGVIHCFSGSVEMAREFIKLGYKLGIGGVLTFKNSKLYQVIEKIDLKNIVLETDSPYLSPEPVRGKKNSPLNLEYIVKYISNIKNISYEDVINVTNNTANTLFDLNIKLC